MRIAALPILLLAVVSCDGGQQPADTPSASAEASVEAKQPDPSREPARAPAARAVSIEEENATLAFRYAYPAQAVAIAPMKAFLDGNLEQARRSTMEAGRDDRASAQENGYPYRRHSFEKEWQVVTNTPRFLSLSAETYFYSGGAHGMIAYDAVLWDRTAQERLSPLDVFASPAALSEAIHGAFCDAIDRQRAQKRGGPVERSDTTFNDCIDPVAQTLILGSSNGRAIDRIGFLIGPYAAGSYAEGSYEVTLPVDPAILAAVKPAYRDAFAVR